jgi:TP901 family phage tail tape measure protein
MSTNAKILETVVSISGAIDPSLRKSLLTAQKELKKTNLAALAGKAAMVAAAAAVVKYGTQAVKQAASYQKQLSNISTVLDGSTEAVQSRLKVMSKELIAVSNNTGASLEDIADGTYQVVQAFGDSADAAKQVEIAAKIAKAGNATTAESVKLLAGVTRAYGDTSLKAQQKVADLAFLTANYGETTIPELAASLGDVIPVAVALGVEQEQIMGAMATLTGVTGNTAEVTTQLKATMTEFLSPSEKMAKAVKGLGYSSAAAMLESEGLQGSLDILKASVNGDSVAFANLFGSVRAQTAVLSMAGAQSQKLTQYTKEMYNAVGTADKAFARQTDNLEDRWNMIKNLGTNALTEIGMEALPFLQEAIETLLPELKKILPDIVQSVGSIFKELAPILPILTDLVIKILPLAVELINTIVPFVSELLKMLMPIFDIVLQLVADLLPPLMPLLDLVLAILKPILELLEPIAQIIEFIVKAFSTGLEWFVNLFVSDDKTQDVVETAKMAGFATGGITDGIGIVGENPAYPTEYVISSDPTFRNANIGYWTAAGEMLGVLDPESAYGGSSTTVIYDFGGLTFAPVIYADKDTDTNDLMKKLRAVWPEFIDEIKDEIDKREEGNYVRRGERVF